MKVRQVRVSVPHWLVHVLVDMGLGPFVAAMGVLVVFVGLSTCWSGLATGGVGRFFKHLLIAVLASVPKMVRGDGYTPGLAWRNESEWFGGPKDGLDAADRTDPKAISADADRGGASARW